MPTIYIKKEEEDYFKLYGVPFIDNNRYEYVTIDSAELLNEMLKIFDIQNQLRNALLNCQHNLWFI